MCVIATREHSCFAEGSVQFLHENSYAESAKKSAPSEIASTRRDECFERGEASTPTDGSGRLFPEEIAQIGRANLLRAAVQSGYVPRAGRLASKEQLD